jgi:hypothetical protein
MRLQQLLWRVLLLRRHHQRLKPCLAMLLQHPSLLTLLLVLLLPRMRQELGSQQQPQQ